MSASSSNRCAYCGARIPAGATACSAHAGLLSKDPRYLAETRSATDRLELELADASLGEEAP